MPDSSELRASYEQAINAFKAADYRASELCRTVSRTGQALANWQNVAVSGHQFTGSFATSGATIIGGEPWPTMQQIGEALVAWHEAKRAAKEAFMLLPESLRSGVEPPPY